MISLFRRMAGIACVLVFALAAGIAVASAQQEDRRLAGKLKLDEIVTYRAFDEYQEAPELAALVAAGKLPPVKERLPEEPRVIRASAMVDGPGVYGGVWRDTFGVPVESWNWGAGQTQGYFGVNEIVQGSGLVDLYPMWMMESPEPAPALAKSWEWSEDGHSLTMHLMRGVRWSDGHPFTADDVLFTFNHFILDPNVPSWVSASAWTFGGEVTRLEKIDDYTIRFHFGAPFPVAAFYRMGFQAFSMVPKHIFEKLHPATNPDATYAQLLNAAPPEELPPVGLGPFVPVRYAPGEQLVLVRNPFYWQVDEEGKQLPYIGEVWFNEGASGEQRTFNLIANQGDRDNVENPQIFGTMFRASQQPDSHFTLKFEDFSIGYRVIMNFATEVGIVTERERALREMFRNFTFRRALSHAIDREGLATAAFPGELTRAWYGGYPSGSPFYDESVVTKYPYDPQKARELLAELGFRDTNGNGILNWPEGTPVAGDELIIEILAGQDQAAAVEAAQMLVSLFRDVGIDLRLRVVTGPVLNDIVNGARFDMVIGRVDRPTPDIDPASFGPLSLDDPDWHRSGPGGVRKLLPFEEEMEALIREAQFTTDPVRTREIYRRVLQLSTENIYTLGLYEARRGLAVHKRLKNIPDDLPTFMYEWGMENMPWVAWVAPEDQFTPRFQHLIPTPETYAAMRR